MIGFEVIAPKLVALEWRRKRQRTSSCGIVRASSSVAAGARWLATPPFADVQETFAASAPHPTAAQENSNAAASAATDRADRADRRRGRPPPAPSARVSADIAVPTEHARKISRRRRS